MEKLLSRILCPNSERKDLDPFELINEMMVNPSLKPYLPPGLVVPDLLTEDIEQKLAKGGKQVWLIGERLRSLKEELKGLAIEYIIDKEKYQFWVGHHSWIQEIWAMPVELRQVETSTPYPATSSRFCYSLKDATQNYFEPQEGSQGKECGDKRVMLVLNIYTEIEASNTTNLERVLRSRLMALYSRADERFAKLCTILRVWKWGQFDKIDTKGVFSSYAFELMLIHFLQVGCQPPVLPCLHRMGIDKFTSKPSDIVPMSKNKKSVGNLLFNFFNYYEMKQNGGFDYKHWKISVKGGSPRLMLKKSKGFWIEDPIGKGSRNVVDESKCPGMSHILTYMFTQIRIRLMKERRLSQLYDHSWNGKLEFRDK